MRRASAEIHHDAAPASPVASDRQPPPVPMPRRLRPLLLLAGAALLATLAVVALHRLTIEIRFADLADAVRSTPAAAIAWSVLATAASYAALIGYDVSALRYVGARPPRGTTALAAFAGYALGNAVGLGSLTGGAVRYRIYAAAGVPPARIAGIVLFIAAAFGIGVTTVGAAGLALQAETVGPLFGLPIPLLRGGACLVLAAAAAFVVLCAVRRGTLSVGPLRLALPTPGLALAQLALTAVDVAAAAAALWALLPPTGIGFAAFASIYAVAIALGVISHVPGGVGVFEAVVLLALGGSDRGAVPAEIAAALLLYRAIYFMLPLLAAAAVLAVYEVRRSRVGRALPAGTARMVRAAGRLTPKFLGAITFFAGTVLLLSGATPAFGDRLAALRWISIPLWMVEASHFLGSTAGIALLLAARGLVHRLDAAWWVATVLVAANLFLSLTKGLAIGETALMGFLLLVLVATRNEFSRRASLLDMPITAEWLAAVGCVVAATVGVLFFAFRDVQYAHELWWQFELDAQAPRALRATLGVVLAGFALGLTALLRPAAGRVLPPTDAEIEAAHRILRAQPRADANLALMGDKSFLFSASGEAFLMFARRGQTWAALFDPVGPRDEWGELIWRFVELADAHGGRAAFYQVRTEALPPYIDAGMKLLKLGEEARVPLDSFDLKGAGRADLRYALKRGERDGLSMEIVPAERVRSLMPELTAISKEWLARHKSGEKRFSVAGFVTGFVLAQPVALLRQEGRPVAFATIMTTDLQEEATVGLMRHRAEASRYAMEYLFIRLILHFKEQGYRSFSLGMAPLSGLGTHRLAPRWHRIGRLIWTHGRRSYNFQGLRTFKNKFEPDWEPRYLAASGRLGAYLALADIARLASGSDGEAEDGA